MYGLVNSGMRRMVLDLHGPQVWKRIVARVPGCPEDFRTMESYPDQITYDVLGAASAELGVPAGDLLQAFGVYWVGFASRAGYAVLMQQSGGSLEEFLMGLDAMHSRLALTYPKDGDAGRWPSFRVKHRDGVLSVEYFSEREGLQPFVVGLLYGLAAQFETKITVEHAEGRDLHPDHDVFLVRYVND